MGQARGEVPLIYAATRRNERVSQVSTRRLRHSLFVFLIIICSLFSTEIPSFAGTITIGNSSLACWYDYDGSSYAPTCSSSDPDTVYPNTGGHAWRVFLETNMGSVTMHGYCHTTSGSIAEDTSFQAGTSSGGANSIDVSRRCDADTGFTGAEPARITVVQDSTHSVYWEWTNSGSLAPWCSDSDYQIVEASLIGTQYTIKIHWGNTTLPTSGWKVYDAQVAHPPPGGSTPVATIPLSSSIGSGWYYYTFTDSTASGSFTLYSGTNTSLPGCSIDHIAGSVVPDTSTEDTGNDTQTSSNGNCGFSLNPFHYLKCLFEPSHSLQQWNDLKTTASTHVPFSLVLAADPYISAVFTRAGDTNGCDVGSNNCPQIFDSPTVSMVGGSSCAYDGQDTQVCADGNHVDILGAAANQMQHTTWGQILYGMLRAIIIVGALFTAWTRVSASLGGKDGDGESA